MDYVSSINNPAQPLAAYTESTTVAVRGASRSLDLSITTAEGDTFTLSSNSSLTAGYASYDVAGASAQVSSLKNTNELSISIQGNLDKKEIRDIAKAIHSYLKVVKDLSSGRTQPAEAHTRQLSRLDEISSFEGSFRTQEYLSVQTQSVGFEYAA